MNPDLERAVAEMTTARRQLVTLIGATSGADLSLARPGGWTLARVLQHVIESEGMYARLLGHQCGRGSTPVDTGEPADGIEAASKLAAARAAVNALIEGIDDATLYRMVRFGHEEYSPLSVLENIASHDRDHYRQLADVMSRSPARSRVPTAASQVTVRAATIDDLPRLTEIYNHYVVHTPTTFDLEPFTVGGRREWFGHYATTGPHRLMVAERDGEVLGYTSSSRFHPRRAYDTTVEMTILCAPEAIGMGIGQRLYEVIFDTLRREDAHMAVAAITLPNDASCAIHERFGFERIGVLGEVGRKFGQYWDVAWYGKHL